MPPEGEAPQNVEVLPQPHARFVAVGEFDAGLFQCALIASTARGCSVSPASRRGNRARRDLGELGDIAIPKPQAPRGRNNRSKAGRVGWVEQMRNPPLSHCHFIRIFAALLIWPTVDLPRSMSTSQSRPSSFIKTTNLFKATRDITR